MNLSSSVLKMRRFGVKYLFSIPPNSGLALVDMFIDCVPWLSQILLSIIGTPIILPLLESLESLVASLYASNNSVCSISDLV